MNSQPAPIQHIPQQPSSQQSSSAGPSVPQQQANLNPTHLRQANIAPVNVPIPAYMQQHNHSNFAQQPPQQQQPSHLQQQQQWYGSIAAPQPSVPIPTTLPQAPAVAPPQERTPPMKSDQWDESYLSVLHAQDPSKLRDLLARTNPDLVLPLNGTPLVSQAVILTLIHRVSDRLTIVIGICTYHFLSKLSAVIGGPDILPSDDMFKSSLWWLQRVSNLLHPEVCTYILVVRCYIYPAFQGQTHFRFYTPSDPDCPTVPQYHQTTPYPPGWTRNS